jgi:ATP-binding cassette, subfamily C, type I secretion system permease/ATPase
MIAKAVNKAARKTKGTQKKASAKPAIPPPPPRSELAAALTSCRSAFLGVGLFSGMSNVLMLTGAIFMLQIYDRVLPSGSVPTLVALAILAAGLFTALAILDLIRGRILVRIGAALDEDLSARVYDAVVRLPLKAANRGDGLQPLRDLDAIRAFLSSLGPTALFDLPWIPIYLAIIFAFHTMLGLTALVGAIILVVLTILTEVLTRAPIAAASGFALSRNGLAEAGRRNAEVLAAMGMGERMGGRWREANQSYMASQRRTSDVAGGFGSVSKVLRMMLQSAVLGVGAYLVINQEATAGIIIAGAILAGRALAPVDLAITNWRGFVAARQSWQRLTRLLALLPAQSEPMALPTPRQNLSVEQASAVPPGDRKVVVQDVSFTLKAGQGLGIIGSSAAGKSSLVRMLVGVWQPARGRIRLDGAALNQWSPEALGPHIGYLPQDVELFAGTVADNIARFETAADPEVIIAAAKTAGVHELIVALPQGYETEIGEQGTALSAGQRQRIALARALYGDPFLVVLDEPNSNLDSEGEAALTQAILAVRKRGGIVVVVSHRPATLAGVDLVLTLAQGNMVAIGPRDEVLAKVLHPVPSAPNLPKVAEGRKGKRQ